MIRCQRSHREWFAEAARCYLERHQGCPWCGGSHLVIHRRRDSASEYCCIGCDFRAGYDAASDHYFSYAGEEESGTKPATMFEI
jgi:hypothetical protein